MIYLSLPSYSSKYLSFNNVYVAYLYVLHLYLYSLFLLLFTKCKIIYINSGEDPIHYLCNIPLKINIKINTDFYILLLFYLLKYFEQPYNIHNSNPYTIFLRLP